MLIYLTKCKIHLIAPNLESYDKFNLFINEFGNSQFFNSKIIFPSEKEKEIIQYEMNEFNQHLPKKLSQHLILKISAFCVSTFMIRRFYYKSHYFDLDFFQYSKYKDKLNENRIILQEFKKDQFIILRDISSNTSLAFHKKTNHLVVLKYKQIFINKEEFQKEMGFYNKINEIKGTVKCFGYITNDGNEVKALFFEFMENGTLQNFINKKKKSYNYLFSFQIIETLNELHLNNIIHRDLKPDNIFINHDLNVYIGDFDCSRIFSNSMNLTHSLTKDIGFIYASPEMINSQQYTKSTDIYSFGLVLYFIYMKEHPYQDTKDIEIINIKNEKKIHHFKQKFEDEFIQNIYLKCIKINPNERPKSNDIVNNFIDISFSTIHTDQIKLLLYLLINENLYIRDRILSIYKQKYNEEIQPLNTLYILYLLLVENYGKNNVFNMRKTRKYITNLALKRNPSAYFIFGEYCFHKITPLVSEGIYFYELAANQNIIQAQLTLSKIYSKGKYVPRDMNKSLHYLKLAADLNSLTALIILGQYFYDGRHVDKNINKSIHYYTLAAKQNDADALVKLGKIFFDNENIPRDVNKAIHFFSIGSRFK